QRTGAILQPFEVNPVADTNRPALEDLTEDTGAPVWSQWLLHFFHQATWWVLSADVHRAAADDQFSTARAFEIEAANHDVRASRGWIDVHSQFFSRAEPGVFIDDRDLPPPALIRVA